jgi:Immune inhibitor A peptidase M6
LRDAAGNPVAGKDIDSLAFKGVTSLPPKPVQWTVDPNPPGHDGNAALYSGTGDERDEAIVKQVTVPSGARATLGFSARWNMEEQYDFAFAQVSTDHGGSYQSLACTDTTTTNVAPDAIAGVVDSLPGLTGDSAGWTTESCSLSAYQGQTVLLAFRTINDPSAQGTDPTIAPGFWVDDVVIGSSVSDGSSLDGWQSPTQIRPTSVANYAVTVISVRDRHGGEIKVRRLRLDSSFATRNRRDARGYVDERADRVYAVVTYDDPTETIDQYAPYMLTVNNVLQPGGS